MKQTNFKLNDMRLILVIFAVADILLWRKRNISAAVLIGSTIIWFLFQVAEYNFVSLLCHISIIAMMFLFIWYSGAGLANW